MNNLDHQNVPWTVLQILVYILDDDTTPKDFNYTLTSSMTVNMISTILVAGWKSLNLFFYLRRTSFTPAQLTDLTSQVRSVIYDMYVLFRLKQDSQGVSTNYGSLSFVYIVYTSTSYSL